MTTLFQYHPIIGNLFIPNLKARIEHESGGYLVRVNEAGFRSEREFVKEKSEGKFRVLLFGDSFTAGDGVSNKYRYGDVLEKILPDVEVYNFGLPGTGTDQHYLVYREIAKEYEHDLVIIAVQVENIRRVAARYRLTQTSEDGEVFLAKPYFEIDSAGNLELNNIPVPKEPLKTEDLPEAEKSFVDQGGRMLWLRRIVGKMGGSVKDLAQQISNYQPLPEYDDSTGREWTLMRKILLQWTDEAEKPCVIMTIPLYHYVEETASPENYIARFEELIPCFSNTILHNPLSDYYAVPKKDRRALRFETDIHPTPKHHELLAESLAQVIRQKFNSNAQGASAE